MTADQSRPATGRDVLPRQARPRVRPRVEYPGRDRVDLAHDQLRRSLLRASREAVRDEQVAREFAELVDQVVAELLRLRAAADEVVRRSPAAQAEVQKQLAKMRRVLRRAAAAGDARAIAVAEHQVEVLSSMLVTQDI